MHGGAAEADRADADLKDAARKIAFFKLCNSGQICININQVAVAKEVADRFVLELQKAFTKQIGFDPLNNSEYPRLITWDAYRKCADEAEQYRDRIVCGGIGDPDALKYAPTIIYPVGLTSEWGFREFTHPSTVLIGSTHFNLSLREHPYTGKGKWKLAVLREFER